MDNAKAQKELLEQALWSAQWGQQLLTRAEARALFQAYFNAQMRVSSLHVKAQRASADAAAQRAVVERLTNELDQHQKGHA